MADERPEELPLPGFSLDEMIAWGNNHRMIFIWDAVHDGGFTEQQAAFLYSRYRAGLSLGY